MQVLKDVQTWGRECVRVTGQANMGWGLCEGLGQTDTGWADIGWGVCEGHGQKDTEQADMGQRV